MNFRLHPLALPLRAPLHTSHHTHRVRTGFVLGVDEDGIQGMGECMPLPEFGTESLEVAWRAVEHVCANETTAPRDIESIAGFCATIPVPAARHAIEQALLDLAARRAGMPLHRYLSADSPPAIPVHALLSGATPAELGASARAAWDEGYRSVKVKAGFDDDEARVAAVRRSLPPDASIRLDANGSWDPSQARTMLHMLSKFGVELCEQPIAPGDVDSLARIAESSPIPIAADESLSNPAELEQIISQRAVPILVLKPMVLGGLLTALRIAHRAHARGMASLVTSAMDGVVARAGAAHLAAALPGPHLAAGLSVGRLFIDEGPDPLAPRGGRINLLDRPGLGVESSWTAC